MKMFKRCRVCEMNERRPAAREKMLYPLDKEYCPACGSKLSITFQKNKDIQV